MSSHTCYPCPAHKHPSGKGNRIERNPSGKGNLTRREIGLLPFASSNRDEVPHLSSITRCRAQPCRRKRETHRGFHIQCSDSPARPYPPLTIARLIFIIDLTMNLTTRNVC